MSDLEPIWGTYRQAAARTGLSVKSLRRLVRDHKLNGYRPLAGRRVLLNFAELDRLIEASGVCSISDQ
jgi:excisionase family DNA binding protein